MTVLIKYIHEFEDKFDRSTEHFAFRHPYLSFLAIFIGMPILIISACCEKKVKKKGSIVFSANDIASLRVFMDTLQKKIEKGPGSPQYIQTHIGVGYLMLKVE